MSNVNALKKVASESTPLAEGFAAFPAQMLLRGNPATASIASVLPTAAYFAGLASGEDNSPKSIGPAFLPGVSSFRQGNRIKTQVLRELRDIKKNKKHDGAAPVAHAIAEHLGTITSTVGAAGAGAGIGALLGGRDGAVTGTGAGILAAGAASVIAALAAAIRRRRTKDEQIESDKGSVLAKYLIPGTALHGYFRRMGRAQGEIDEAHERKEKRAQAGGEKGLWDNVMGYIDQAKAWYNDPKNEAWRPWIGAGVGALGMGALSKLFGGKFGTGALIGGLGGAAATQVDWKALSDSFGKKKQQPASSAGAASSADNDEKPPEA